MDYTGENNDRWDIWIPETGGNADRVDDSARDAMKELAGLVSVTDRRDYTITEYVNDITRENEEVLAELNLRGKITTAYTYGYNGESVNLATGLQYLRARYYNPQIGSFLTEDTYAGQLSNPLTLNRYDYVSNNPVNYIDPSGHFGLKGLINGAKQLASDVWDGVTGFVEEAGNAIGNGISALEKGLSAIGNAYMQGQQMIQQNQRIEQQAVSNLLGGNSSQSSQNRLKQALNDKKPLVKPEPEEKDKRLLQMCWVSELVLLQEYMQLRR